MDVSVSVDGANLFPPNRPGHHSLARVFSATGPPHMGSRDPGVHLVWMEPRELVSHAWPDRGGFVFAGGALSREKHLALSSQARIVVCRRHVDRGTCSASLCCPVRCTGSGHLFPQPCLGSVVLPALAKCILFSWNFAWSGAGF